MLIQKRKILLVGPPGAGKTTIKKAFFDKEDPFKLLKNPLSPSRGINSSAYSYSNSNLGVFDLAGQENERWFSDKGKEVFSKTSVIICIFDIRASLESIIEFLLRIYKLKRELILKSCKIITFLHKVDTSEPTYVSHKVIKLKEFINSQQSLRENIQFFETSIDQHYFYRTFSSISDILNELYKNGIISVNIQEIKLIQENLYKILGNKTFSDQSDGILHKSKYDNLKVGLNLKFLETMNLVERTSNSHFFKLTERAQYLRIGWESEKLKKKHLDLKECIECFHVLLFLNDTVIYD